MSNYSDMFRGWWGPLKASIFALAIVTCAGGAVRAAEFSDAPAASSVDIDAALAEDMVVIYDFPETFAVGYAFQNAMSVKMDMSQIIAASPQELIDQPHEDNSAVAIATPRSDKAAVVKIPIDAIAPDSILPVTSVAVNSTGDSSDASDNWDDLAASAAPGDISTTAIYVGVAGLIVVVGMIAATVAFGKQPEQQPEPMD
jgi:hypothetical protein